MPLDSLIFMILSLTLIWGGLIFFLSIAIRKM